MSFQEAVNRINNIKIITPVNYDHEGLISEYMKGIALFFYKESIMPKNPLFTNIATLLGDEETIKLEDYCKIDKEILENKYTWVYVLKSYLQLKKYAEKK